MRCWIGLSRGRNLMWCMALTLLVPSSASAQSITAYEVSPVPQSGGATPKPFQILATNVTCAAGALPASSTVWFLAAEPLKVVFTRAGDPAGTVCTGTGPTAGSVGLTTGQLYTSTAVAINDAGIRSVTASPASNPFGLSGPPPNVTGLAIQR